MDKEKNVPAYNMRTARDVRTVNVDIDALLAAFEYNTGNMSYYLDLESGRVLMIADEVRWELEAIYEEFYDPDTDDDFNLQQVLQQRALPEWHQRALLQADAVEEYYIRQYIDVPVSDSNAAYQDMQNFINKLDDKVLRQKMWRAISAGKPFRKFKTMLGHYPRLRNRWFTYSAKQARQRVLDWLRKEGLQLPPRTHTIPINTSSRARLIAEVLNFVREARTVRGIIRIALIGSLTTHKANPKDADILVTIADDIDMPALAELGRRALGHAQSFNHSADVFVADALGNYLGRTCPWKQCEHGLHAACDALNCGKHTFLHDDLHTIRLSSALIAAPPLELWPDIVTRISLPKDIQFNLIAPLRAEKR